MNDLINIFSKFLSEKNINSESFFLVAVSGGIDSMVCLHIAKELNLKIAVAHVNFQLRNNESDLDAELIENYCNEHNIPFHLLVKNAKEYSSEHKTSIQEAAREIRYDFFNSLIDSSKYQYVITAHHHNDNIETLFLHLNRGAGLKGLSGIPSVRDVFLRPLLSVNKEKIIEYVKHHEIPFRDDSSNKDLKYDRNFIRNVILSKLSKRFPDFEKGVKSSLTAINEDHSLLMSLIHEKIKSFVKQEGNSFYITPDQSISMLTWFHYLKRFGFNHSQVTDLLEYQHQSGMKFISKSYVLYVDRNNWIIKRHEDNNENIYAVKKNGSIDLPIKISCSTIKRPENLKCPPEIAYFDIAKLNFPLQLRKWMPGDVFSPLGMKGKKKVSDLLIDTKTPLPDKDITYVLLSNNKIIWVIGKQISENHCVRQTNNTIYKIKYS